MSEAIKKAMGYMQGTLNSIQETAKIVYNLANKTGLTSSERLQQLTEMSRELGSHANQIQNAYEDMTKQFAQGLKIGNEQLAEYLTKANESYTNRIQESEIVAARFCQQINQTAHGLMDVSHYLVASAKELKNGKGSGN
jgi:ubiquinone biosynthesis protein UbiJ